jgi:hypothetical protein
MQTFQKSAEGLCESRARTSEYRARDSDLRALDALPLFDAAELRRLKNRMREHIAVLKLSTHRTTATSPDEQRHGNDPGRRLSRKG